MIGNIKNRSTKLGQEYADADHKFSTTPPSTEKVYENISNVAVV